MDANILKELNDDNKLKKKWYHKRSDAKANNIECNLTFEEYCKLVDEAGLKSSQLGYTGENYVLARYNDEGPYEYGNCRFITQKENIHEKKITDRQREVSRQNMMKAVEQNRQMSAEEIYNRMLASPKYQEYLKKLKDYSEQFQDTIEICYICGNPIEVSAERHRRKYNKRNKYPNSISKYFCCSKCQGLYGTTIQNGKDFAIHYEK